MKKFYFCSLILVTSMVLAGCYTSTGRGAVRGATTGAAISSVAGGDAGVGAAVGGAVGATTGAMRSNRYRRYYRW